MKSKHYIYIMKNYLLLPNKYKVLGWVLFLAAFAAFTFCYQIYPNYLSSSGHNLEFKTLDWTLSDSGSISSGLAENFQQEFMTSAVIIGLLLISFSREKREDEYIAHLRLQSFQWAILISYGILLVANWVIYGMDFLGFMIYNLLTVLLVFIIKFNFSLYMLTKKGLADEK